MKTIPLCAFLALTPFAGQLAFAAPSPAASTSSAPAAAQADPFAVGSVWTGRRHFHKADKDDAKGGGKGQRWSLHIETRQGDQFSGYIVLFDTAAAKTQIAVSGSAPADGAGYVGFATTEAKGEARQRFTGSIKNDVIELEFKGRSVMGDEVEGTAGLSRKK